VRALQPPNTRLSLALVTLVALPLVPARNAEACPCLTLVDSHADEVAQRALLLVADDGLDYILQLAVIGDAQELGWIIPTPAVAEPPILVEPGLFDHLDQGTTPLLVGCGGGGGCAADSALKDRSQDGVDVWSQGRLEDLEYAVLSASDGADLQAWLQGHGYPVSTAAQAVIDAYVAEGWAFVALRVSGGALEGERPALGPIRVHVPYSGTPVFPLRLSALSHQGRTSLLLYVAAVQPMRPSSYPLVEIDVDRLRHDETGGSNYLELLRQAIDAEERGFVLEYVGAEPGLSAQQSLLDGDLEGLQLVRLHTDLPPAALAEDLTLAVDITLVAPAFPCVPQEGDPEEGGCAAGGRAIGAWGPLLLLLLGLLATRAGRSRRRRQGQ